MKRIAICDDEAYAICELRRLLHEYEKQEGTVLKVLSFSSAGQLLRSVPNYDLIILDIQMDGLNGMDAAKKLRSSGIGCPIVFLTALKEYVFEAFDVDAVNYLVKPVDREKLFHAIRKALKENPSELLIKQGHDYQKINISNILYCESVGRKVSIHTTRGPIEYYQKIRELPALLGKTFFAVHRSFLLNLEHLAAIDGSDAVMDNGDRVPVAKGKKEELVRRLLDYFQEQES